MARAYTNAKTVLSSRDKIPPNAILEIGREKHPFANWFIAPFPDISKEEKYCWWETWDFTITGRTSRKSKTSKLARLLRMRIVIDSFSSRQIMFECGRGSKLVDGPPGATCIDGK